MSTDIKGQMSMDMLFAIIIALLLLSTLDMYAKTLQQDTDQLAEKNSAKAILLRIYSAAANAKAYKLSIDLNASTGIIRKNTELNCRIRFDTSGGAGNHYIKAKVGNEDANYSKLDLTGLTVQSPKGSNALNSDIPCNRQLTLIGT